MAMTKTMTKMSKSRSNVVPGREFRDRAGRLVDYRIQGFDFESVRPIPFDLPPTWGSSVWDRDESIVLPITPLRDKRTDCDPDEDVEIPG